MRYPSLLLNALLIALFLVTGCQPTAEPADPIQVIHADITRQIQGLDEWCAAEWEPLIDLGHPDSLRQAFLRGHARYKAMEWAVEYFFPFTADQLNGAALPEIEEAEHQVEDPMGFQVLEELVFADKPDREALRMETRKVKSLLVRLDELWAGHQFRPDQTFDAIRFELYRLASLTLAGFDLPVSGRSIHELQPTLHALEQVVLLWKDSLDSNGLTRFQQVLDGAGQYAAAHPDFNTFDRYTFLQSHLIPLMKALHQIQSDLGIPFLDGVYAFRGNARHLFDEGALDPDFFSSNVLGTGTPERIALGERLFYDTSLSGNGQVSCASCHRPELAFTDGLVKAAALGSAGSLTRNTPTLLYAGYQQAQFYDLRSKTLEDQIDDVIHNRDEIHGNLDLSAETLAADPDFVAGYQAAFPGQFSIDPGYLRLALSAYVRSLGTFNSRFDLAMRGGDALSPDEQAGFNLFMGKGKCGTCHFMPVFNGTIPPHMTNSESEVLGVPADVAGRRIDPDSGRYLIHAIPQYAFSFKTPTVRNSRRTAPYMHNGVYPDLESVLDFYNLGGGNGLGFDLPYQTLPSDSLGLTPLEIRQILAFLGSLDDSTPTY